jgi:4-alpha-glucanotransferase
MRTSGILLPIFSLPTTQGIGSFSREAFEFVDFLAEAGQKYWQILPLVPPGACESPYQSISTFAGNPLFIDVYELLNEGLIDEDDIEEWGGDKVDYNKVREYKTKLLKKAFKKSEYYRTDEYVRFYIENSFWLEEYVQLMWLRNDEKPAYYRFEQFMFFKQWMKVKEYANSKGIKIIGDLPIYVSLDSTDVFFHKELFEVDNDGKPYNVAGCEPDWSCKDGQVWGNPLYNWWRHGETNFDWWIKRVRHCFKLHDVVRLDHFRGFYDYYSIPYGDKTAKNGFWRLGPGFHLFQKIKERLGDVEFIAEDLGFLSQGVHDLMRDTGFPGMKILHFAFNGGKDNPYLPENISENYVVYTGTHDNNTTVGWYNEATEWEKEHLKQYIPEIKDISWDLVELAMSTKANTCIIQMQDYLGLGAEHRVNTPGTININWMWMMTEMPDKELANRIRSITKQYNRI